MSLIFRIQIRPIYFLTLMLCNRPTEVEPGEVETQAEPKTQGDTAGLEGWGGATSLEDSGVARPSKD